MDDPAFREMERAIAAGDRPAFLAALRAWLDYRRELATMELAATLIGTGATDEEMELELAYRIGEWAAETDRHVAQVEAWLRRGGRALQ